MPSASSIGDAPRVGRKFDKIVKKTGVVFLFKRPKTRYQAPDPKNTLPSTRKHKTHHQKPFPQALTERALAFQPPWARFTGSRR